MDSFVILFYFTLLLLVIDANPFLQKVQKQLSSRLQRMPEMYSVTSVLNAWVSSGYNTTGSDDGLLDNMAVGL